MANVFQRMKEKGILPVLNIERVEWAIPLAKALRDGGLPLIEVTLRSDASLQAIEAIHKTYPEMSIAAGTVLSPQQAEEAISAGAELIVTPGCQAQTMNYCVEHGISVLPGCVTATEITTAVDMGLMHVKFFPAEKSGGVQAIDLLGGPFKSVAFVPTGGIGYHNLQAYLGNPRVLACGGSYMAKVELMRCEDWGAITRDCEKALDIALGFRLAHVGINHTNEKEAMKAASVLCRLLRIPMDERSKSIFAGSYVENMKYPFYGTKGHIGFHTNSLFRALAWLSETGFEVLEESKQYDKDGQLSCVYLKNEIAGFAIHLI